MTTAESELAQMYATQMGLYAQMYKEDKSALYRKLYGG